ncbi:hypothetical protein BO70DRAFT_353140 [Aspergillus heteromorphus CBS 117.55]|uniref:Uncharacterized protein n=1 Tax=Aspergillus heteromorphus CBS 117.55 TaxID=1448321 RepID=A0A317W1Q9_9EURO|nr:uncharacterized protein BO70DRAFT_353140 [Aspergillus heteromorphus CBS 117.55]PWY80576.1 hypothetical protein BO70DRAFT_353140 [Aspergillus heteromorphus CBS 117.55]
MLKYGTFNTTAIYVGRKTEQDATGFNVTGNWRVNSLRILIRPYMRESYTSARTGRLAGQRGARAAQHPLASPLDPSASITRQLFIDIPGPRLFLTASSILIVLAAALFPHSSPLPSTPNLGPIHIPVASTMKMEDFVCPPDTFRPACPLHLRSTFSHEDTRFRFTPVKVAKSAPRVWERKPSTAFRARGKSRTVWKRFRSSFNSMKGLQQLVGAERHTIDEELQLEINVTRNPGLLRGTKRRCFALETDGVDGGVRGRSFLETQWESETYGRRRKLPLVYSDFVDIPDEPVEFDSLQPGARDDVSDAEDEPTSTLDETLAENSAAADESSSPIPDTPTRLAPAAAYPRLLHGHPALVAGGLASDADIKAPERGEQPVLDISDASAEDSTTPDETDQDESVETTLNGELLPVEQPTVTVDAKALNDPAADLTAEQESTLVRSALRSSLDGEDAELLSNFLSKAKAKREAKAAAMVAQDAEPEKTDPETTAVIASVVASPIPQSRRVLEDLDTNSPSPQKSQQSPTKALDNENGSPQPSSPRRSTRPRTTRSSPMRTATAAAAVRNTLSLRRAKGTEFIFLQRTEAQELALATRRNTRLNRGNALMPKFVLQGLVRKSQESKKEPSSTTPSSDDDKPADDSGRPPKTAKKHVSWNDAQLVRFQGDEDGVTDPRDVAALAGKGSDNTSEQRKAASSRTTRAQAAQKTGGEDSPDAATTAPATATPRTRRVRRLGAGAPKLDLTMACSPSSPSSSDSPVQKRKKLTPKSPKTAMETPSKSVGGIKTSLRSSSAKTNLLKVNAGSTPVARKVRPRP